MKIFSAEIAPNAHGVDRRSIHIKDGVVFIHYFYQFLSQNTKLRSCLARIFGRKDSRHHGNTVNATPMKLMDILCRNTADSYGRNINCSQIAFNVLADILSTSVLVIIKHRTRQGSLRRWLLHLRLLPLCEQIRNHHAFANTLTDIGDNHILARHECRQPRIL